MRRARHGPRPTRTHAVEIPAPRPTDSARDGDARARAPPGRRAVARRARRRHREAVGSRVSCAVPTNGSVPRVNANMRPRAVAAAAVTARSRHTRSYARDYAHTHTRARTHTPGATAMIATVSFKYHLRPPRTYTITAVGTRHRAHSPRLAHTHPRTHTHFRPRAARGKCCQIASPPRAHRCRRVRRVVRDGFRARSHSTRHAVQARTRSHGPPRLTFCPRPLRTPGVHLDISTHNLPPDTRTRTSREPGNFPTTGPLIYATYSLVLTSPSRR